METWQEELIRLLVQREEAESMGAYFASCDMLVSFRRKFGVAAYHAMWQLPSFSSPLDEITPFSEFVF